jgi:hypothetical protein
MYSRNPGPDRSHWYAWTLHRGASRGTPCDLGCINGPKLEELVWESVVGLVTNPAVFLAEMERRYGKVDNQEGRIEESIKILRKKLDKLIAMDTDLVNMKLRGEIIPEVFERSLALNKAERTHFQEEIERLKGELAVIEQQHTALKLWSKCESAFPIS